MHSAWPDSHITAPMNRFIYSAFCIVVVTARLAVAQDRTPKRVDHWRADISFFANSLFARHKDVYAHVTKDAFARATAELDEAVPRLSEA